MQRMKGQGNQVPNGPKDQNFSSFQQNYSNPMTSSMAAASDPYMSSFYMTSTPYQTFGVGDGTWSNGGEHMQTFLGGYGGQVGYDSHNTIDGGIFNGGSFGGFNTANFNYGFHGNGEFNAWGNSDIRSGTKTYDEYYQRNVYTDDRVKEINQGVQGLTFTDPKALTDVPKDDRANGTEKIEDATADEASLGSINQPKKGLSWANVASQPAKTQPSRRRDKTTMSSIVPGRHMDIGMWDGKNGGPKPVAPPPAPRPAWEAPRGGSRSTTSTSYSSPPPPPQPTQQSLPLPQSPNQAPVMQSMQLQQHNSPHAQQQHQQVPLPSIGQQEQLPHSPPSQQQQPVMRPVEGASYIPAPSNDDIPNDDSPLMDEMQQQRHDYNPTKFELVPKNARFFVIKSYSEDDIHRSIKYEIWCSTEHGNKRLDNAFREREGKGPIFLFFSVNGSGHFCGIAQMISQVDYNSTSKVWAQDKWKGQFRVKWIYVKDVPNNPLRHIRLENNENKPVTNSRDTQEVPYDKGKQVLKIIHNYQHTSSIFDDFIHYEKRQEESEFRKGNQQPFKELECDDRRDNDIKDHPRNDYRDHPPQPPRDIHREYHRGGPHRGGGRGHHQRGGGGGRH